MQVDAPGRQDSRRLRGRQPVGRRLLRMSGNLSSCSEGNQDEPTRQNPLPNFGLAH